MRWFLFLVAVLALCGGLEIAYWRQTGAGDRLSGMQLFADLFLIPIAFVGTIYLIHRLIKWRKKKREDAANVAPESQNNTPMIDDASMPWLHVHRVAVESYFKNEGSIVERLQNIGVAAVDTELTSPDSNNLIVSRRILDLEPLAMADQPFDFSDRAIRIQAITERLLRSLEDTFLLIAENMAFNQLMSTPIRSSKQQALLHPAWTGAATTPNEEPSGDVPSSSSWSTLSLQIICLLAEHVDQDDRSYIENKINQYIEQYQLNAHHVQIVHQRVKDADEVLIQFNEYGAALALDIAPRMLLLIGADSTLDQDWLELQRRDVLDTPAEAGFALLLSNEAAVLPDLPTIAHISAPIWAVRQKPVSAQGIVGTDALTGIIDELSHRYKMPESSLIPELGVLVTDNSVTVQSAHSEELTGALDKLSITTMKKIAYAGMALEQSNTMISGVTFALAVQHVLESQQHTLVLCSGGETVRTVCLVNPAEENPS